MDGGNRHDRDSDLGDDSPMSHTDEQSDREDEIRDCESSDEGVNVNANPTMTTGGIGFGRSPEHISEMNHPAHFAQNHPLNLLNNLTALSMGQGLQNLQHGDVLEKLKMQVRDMKVGLMDPEFQIHAGYGGSMSAGGAGTGYGGGQNLSTGANGGYPFQSPSQGNTKDANPASNSSTSSEGSNSSQQNNGWSFEEQFKQVRQLYEINDDPKRKEFLDDLFLFMQKRGTPINRLPIMAKSVLDLYELYNLVIARGGLVDVINKKLWQEIIKGLHLPSSITSAAFTLRTQYMKYLYPYECEKKNLSSPAELQAAIDGNRREGRRTSYGQFDNSMQGQLGMPMRRSPVPPSLQQSPIPLVTHQTVAAAAAAQHRMMMPPMSNLVPQEFEKRMLEMYSNFFNNPKEHKRAQSPEQVQRETLNALEMSRLALWNIYNNNTNSPPNSLNTSPLEHQKRFLHQNREALNLSESPPHPSIKRERDRDHHNDYTDRDRDYSYPPEKKRPPSTPTRHHAPPPPALDTSVDDRADTPVPQENGTDYSKSSNKSLRNGGSNLSGLTTSAGGNETTLLNGMQFKIISRGNSATGEQQLVVTMEVNGVQYEGVLFANTGSDSTKANLNTTATSTASSMDERSSSRPMVS